MPETRNTLVQLNTLRDLAGNLLREWNGGPVPPFDELAEAITDAHNHLQIVSTIINIYNAKNHVRINEESVQRYKGLASELSILLMQQRGRADGTIT